MSRVRIPRLALVAVIGAWLALAGVATPAPASAALLAVAVPDTASAVQNVQLTVAAPGVLRNDLDLLGASTADLVSDVSHGNLTLDSDGGYRYRSDSGFLGSDQFRYRILGGLLGPSNTTTVTITVTAPPPTPSPTPKPTPTPSPSPTAAPTPTPKPTDTPRPTATPRPSATPTPTILPSIPPLPTLPPLPTPTPDPSARPTPTPTPGPSTRPSGTPTPTAAPATTDPSTPTAGGGGAGSTGSGSGGPAANQPPASEGPFSIPGPDQPDTIDLDPGSISFASFEWAVPALVLSVPGLLLVLAVAVQALIGLAWIPVARRWVGEDEPRRRRRRRLSPT